MNLCSRAHKCPSFVFNFPHALRSFLQYAGRQKPGQAWVWLAGCAGRLCGDFETLPCSTHILTPALPAYLLPAAPKQRPQPQEKRSAPPAKKKVPAPKKKQAPKQEVKKKARAAAPPEPAVVNEAVQPLAEGDQRLPKRLRQEHESDVQRRKREQAADRAAGRSKIAQLEAGIQQKIDDEDARKHAEEMKYQASRKGGKTHRKLSLRHEKLVKEVGCAQSGRIWRWQ